MLPSEIKRSTPTQDSDIGHLEVEDTETRRGEGYTAEWSLLGQ